MAKTRAQKEAMVSELAEKLQRAKSLVFATFTGLTVTQMEELRAKAREENVNVTVAKKTLMTIAADEAGLKDVDANALPNSVVTLIGFDDEVAPAKLVADFGKDLEDSVTIVGGVLEGAFATDAQMVALSKLPSKQELYAKLVGSLNAPSSGFVNVLAGNLRGLVTALKQIQEQKA